MYNRKKLKILTVFSFLHFRRENRHFVRVPQAVAADYDVAPQSTIRTDKNRNARVSLFVCMNAKLLIICIYSLIIPSED